MRINYQSVSLAVLISFLTGFISVKGQGTTTTGGGSCKSTNYKTNWSVKPFDDQVFIENKGQFTADLPQGDKILYGAQVGDVFAFITNRGLVYKFTQNPCMRQDEDNPKHYTLIDPDDFDASVKTIDHYLKATWEGSNIDISTVAGAQESYYFTYPKGKNGTIIAHGFKKITCQNVYPGIDVEYVFPEGKEGVKYSFIVHPGADASKIKLKYDGAKDMILDNDGNIKINTGWGDFTDHAPVSFYKEDHSAKASAYQLNNSEETFSINNTDASKTLIIDPWSTNWTQSTAYMSSSGYDGAYDCDFDYQGNVYVYGGYNPNQLAQYNSAGVKQWVYITSNFTFPYYGDFCVDKASGTSFALEGFNNVGALVDKISVSGALMLAYTASSSEDELWRATYDLCDHIILVAGGGSTSNTTNQAATLDTNLTTFTMANVMNTPPNDPYHDMALIAMDPLLPIGYEASTHSTSFTNPNYANNVIYQMPMPAMVPTNYAYQDNYTFQEVFSISYVGPGTGNANGMNGMAVSPSWLYTYDGKTLEQHVKATGNLNASATLPGTSSFEWGGLDVDLCDNIYVGNQTDVYTYNSNLAQTGTIGPFSGNVYDVVLGNGVLASLDSTLYVCGKGFLSSIKISPPNPPTITKQRTHVCSCNCTAAVTLNLCGAPDTSANVTYQWSNGQTTHWATGLCPGNTYTCTVSFGCANVFQDTVNFPLTGALTVVKAQTNTTCAVQGTASVTVAGGQAPYTYLWSPNNQTTAGITGLSAGNYCVTITDNKGCQDSACFIISSPPMPTITVPADTMCLNSSVTLTSAVAGGNPPYTYLWSNGGSNATDVVSPAITTTYTATVTDINGCSGSTTVQVVVNQPPTVTIAPQNDTICAGVAGGVVLTATPVGTAPFTYSWTPANSALSSYTTANPTATPTVTTIYTVTVTDAHGCSGTATTTIVIAEPPTISVSATRVSICEGSSVKLIASATNITSPFVWTPGPLTGPLVNVTPTVTTTYTVTASSGCGIASASITINVNQLPVTSFSADNVSGCSPLCVQFRDRSTSASGSIVQWRWAFGNGDSLNSETPVFCYPKPGSYDVTLTTITDSGCSSTLQKVGYVNVYSNPIAAFTTTPQPTTIIASTIQFTDQTTDAYVIVYWSWNFGMPGNDTLSSLQNPSYYYWDTGSYCATEVVMNQHGCMDTATNCLVIDPIYTLYIPDAFSPNADGKNEVFMARGNDVKTFEMYIFDRWGMQLFHSTDINIGWDGTVSGGTSVSQEDTYVYLINVYDHKNKKHSYLGKVNLIK